MYAPLPTAVRLAGRTASTIFTISIVAPVVPSRAVRAAGWLAGMALDRDPGCDLHAGQNTRKPMGGRLRRRIEVRPH